MMHDRQTTSKSKDNGMDGFGRSPLQLIFNQGYLYPAGVLDLEILDFALLNL